ncbi:MAG TPA: PEP-CTERM-box response regulator transcription factor [Nitrosomonas nitrosa]|jgi:two-component system NtrC family response regulator|uniref:Two-component system, NtrC family, response regulator n=1 Tax=Nitrosomonas nitrosa TaxID=52442 RepID=A0A1I4UR85_9PROT|nr:PEP-CTERM-box response regulator transcription factor [Nitrosomonas nitrosa]MCO6434315.1 PEP-CTERM-box response regulator transcription factor [Nitrosomonas nitrosa]PTR02254.1 two-component system NtrC family response regulator [Nitrosomonas nitrosa]CAE6495999.1 Two-component system, NtrC family, response regulator [Nitrosomonas nitrosa]SFM91482.1 two-component system, NtrC family, response regulator [Nitrosomonas nitrosa]HBZ29252.1 PEP-CTERM-box response regulator transcription factor [Nit
MKASEDPKKLLVIEDDPGLQKQLRWSFDNYDVYVAADRESALAQVRRYEPAVVTMDLGLPPDPDGASEGLATLQQILALAPDTKVIVLTGNQNHANALKAIELGAYDFHQKPYDPQMLGLIVDRAFYLHSLQRENRNMQLTHWDSPISGIITRDPDMIKMCRNIERVATSDVTVMLLGESGTGKEVLARALHQMSDRKEGRFVAINCAAIPENLLESELFGYEKGAFTGAVKQTPGKIESAKGGTFFLDEVGDLPFQLQAKLLRFLQERVIERIGGRDEIPVDVRVVCATHQNLKKLIEEGRFREDLFYRLGEIVIKIPPLRSRIGDAILLAHHFKNKFCAKEARQSMSFNQEALAAIEAHQWPGNVREMENCIKRAVIMAEGPQITASDLGLQDSEIPMEPMNLREVRDREECKALVRALAKVDGNIAKAAELLGVSRPTLYDLMNRHGLK